MMNRAWGIAGVGAVGIAAAGIASPAAAAPLSVCGDIPLGTSVSINSDRCVLDFGTAGGYSWTLPTGISGLFGLVVGGGGGALADGGTEGYAGSGGDVLYVDYSAAAAGEAATIVVGAAGVSAGSGPTAGGATVVTLGATTTADGGIAGGFFTPGYCIAGGSGSVYVSVGNGAGGVRGTDGSDCATAFVPGVNPSLGNGDSSGALVPAELTSIAAEFGAGGKVLIAPVALTADLTGSGQGADVRYVAVSTVPTFNATGGSGRVIFTYVTTALLAAGGSAGAGGSATALPATGTEIAAPLGIAGIAAALGALFLALARRRSARA